MILGPRARNLSEIPPDNDHMDSVREGEGLHPTPIHPLPRACCSRHCTAFALVLGTQLAGPGWCSLSWSTLQSPGLCPVLASTRRPDLPGWGAGGGAGVESIGCGDSPECWKDTDPSCHSQPMAPLQGSWSHSEGLREPPRAGVEAQGHPPTGQSQTRWAGGPRGARRAICHRYLPCRQNHKHIFK